VEAGRGADLSSIQKEGKGPENVLVVGFKKRSAGGLREENGTTKARIWCHGGVVEE